ncbi:hypothetical protein ACP70R_014597 [Stipagrostis hirtigluma subsp. patula]
MATPPWPELVDDLVEEVLLGCPPDDPARLVRAALVCKRWRCLVAGPGFRRAPPCSASSATAETSPASSPPPPSARPTPTPAHAILPENGRATSAVQILRHCQSPLTGHRLPSNIKIGSHPLVRVLLEMKSVILDMYLGFSVIQFDHDLNFQPFDRSLVPFAGCHWIQCRPIVQNREFQDISDLDAQVQQPLEMATQVFV